MRVGVTWLPVTLHRGSLNGWHLCQGFSKCLVCVCVCLGAQVASSPAAMQDHRCCACVALVAVLPCMPGEFDAQLHCDHVCAHPCILPPLQTETSHLCCRPCGPCTLLLIVCHASSSQRCADRWGGSRVLFDCGGCVCCPLPNTLAHSVQPNSCPCVGAAVPCCDPAIES